MTTTIKVLAAMEKQPLLPKPLLPRRLRNFDACLTHGPYEPICPTCLKSIFQAERAQKSNKAQIKQFGGLKGYRKEMKRRSDLKKK